MIFFLTKVILKTGHVVQIFFRLLQEPVIFLPLMRTWLHEKRCHQSPRNWFLWSRATYNFVYHQANFSKINNRARYGHTAALRIFLLFSHRVVLITWLLFLDSLDVDNLDYYRLVLGPKRIIRKSVTGYKKCYDI